MRSSDAFDTKRHPQRIERPVYTSTNAVDNMIRNIGPGIKLVKNTESSSRTYTHYKQGRSWSQVLITPSKQETNTSPLTGDTESKIKNLHDEVSKLKHIMDEDRKRTNHQIEMLAETVSTLKDELRKSTEQQNRMSLSITKAIAALRNEVSEMKSEQTKTQELITQQTPKRKNNKKSDYRGNLLTQEINYYSREDEVNMEREMEFKMTDLKRTREDRIIEQQEFPEGRNHRKELYGSPTRKKLTTIEESDPCVQEKGHYEE